MIIKNVFKTTYDRLPSEAGFVVNNVATIIALRDALHDGKVLTERFITVAGDAMLNERTVKARLYMSMTDVVAELGGYLFDDIMISSGGPFMGKSVTGDEFSVTASTSGMLVQQAYEFYEVPCMSCGKCTDSCPAGLQPVQIKNALAMADFDKLLALGAEHCAECGLCSYTCPSRIQLTEKMAIAKKIACAKKSKG